MQIRGCLSSRAAGLTRDRIVDTAIQLLDATGESGLTFRALALELETGHGAIQWHVASKGELLMGATVSVLTRALTIPASGAPPREAIRAVALGVFDAIDAHPWLGAQLFAIPWQPAMVELWEQISRPVEELGVPEDGMFAAVSTLVSYIVGVGSKNALAAGHGFPCLSRAARVDHPVEGATGIHRWRRVCNQAGALPSGRR